ncbi:MAG: hypothetical protein KAX49_08990 [Halanaerobiales bacterium]|nr:hypothetical protein [Halanaerobiales bacterium]
MESDRIARIEDDFSMWLWANYGKQNFYLTEFRMGSGEEKLMIIKGINEEQAPEKKERDYCLSYPDENVALLKVNGFSSENGKKFKIFMENSFKEINIKKCENLIIDIRNNGGGTTALVSYLYGFITDKPYSEAKETRLKLSEYVLEHGEFLKLSKIAKLGDTRILIEQSQLKKPHENQYKFDGCTYVLIGKGTYSAAVAFAAMVKDFSTGILVGEETGGYASHTGNAGEIELPYSGLTLKVATVQNIRPAGYNDGRGVIPYVKVKVDPLKLVQGQDQVLETVIEMIKNR